MKKVLANKKAIKLVGLSARTNTKCEMNPETAKIGSLAGRFWSQGIAERISNRKNPGVTLSVYTDYESDEYGDYTYFIGEEVSSFENVATDLRQLIIPVSNYQKFTTAVGKMPDVVIDAWMQIWKMTAADFGGQRAYRADFEVYDQRARDPNNTSLDVYVGIK